MRFDPLQRHFVQPNAIPELFLASTKRNCGGSLNIFIVLQIHALGARNCSACIIRPLINQIITHTILHVKYRFDDSTVDKLTLTLSNRFQFRFKRIFRRTIRRAAISSSGGSSKQRRRRRQQQQQQQQRRQRQRQQQQQAAAEAATASSRSSSSSSNNSKQQKQQQQQEAGSRKQQCIHYDGSSPQTRKKGSQD